MLFDLQSGKRRRVVQIVYSLLAASFLIGFVIFGVGSGGLGSLSDVLGFGNGNSPTGSSTSQYDNQIQAAQTELRKHPNDESALLRLAKAQYFKGHAELEIDQSTGTPKLTPDSQRDLGAATDAWERYLKVARQPSVGAAEQLVNAFVYMNDAAGAARTQELIAKAKPSTNTNGNLAIYLYFDFKFPAGDAAAKRAVAEAPKSQQQATRKQLRQVRQQAVKLQKQQKALNQAQSAGAAPNPLENPFGGLGGSTSPTP
jgi:hypothetical protein